MMLLALAGIALISNASFSGSVNVGGVLIALLSGVAEYPYLTIRCVAFLLMERRRIGRISGEFCKHSLIFRCAIPGLLVDCL